MSSVRTQVFSASEYPFHLIRYSVLFHLFLLSLISSTLYSSSPLISSGGGSSKFLPCSFVSLYGNSRLAWNTLWIFHPFGNISWYVTGPNLFMTLKGPYRKARSFVMGCVVLMFFASSQTF